MISDSQKRRWLAIAESLKPKLIEQQIFPMQIVRAVADAESFQGWRMEKAYEISDLMSRTFGKGDSLIFDFGTHSVGYLKIALNVVGVVMDSPVRLKITFGEVPAEVCESFDSYDGSLNKSWLQEEMITLDDLSEPIELARRFAFRYVRIEVVDTSNSFRVGFSHISCSSVTSADDQFLTPISSDVFDEKWQVIDQISVHTLKNCMQTVFEDGPKRDRRLWLGDLRLQALANYVTFQNYDLVKRCLYLLAGLSREDGLISGCAYEKPKPTRGQSDILDYAVLFGPMLLDYSRASGDWETSKDLWHVAKTQLDFAMVSVNDQGLFVDPETWWIFIDWSEDLHRQTAMNGVLIYAIRQLALLADELEYEKESASLRLTAYRLTQSAREKLRMGSLFVSGPEMQVSWASQVWMILADVVTPEEGQSILAQMFADSKAIRPGGPYLYHHVIEAVLKCGLKQDAFELLKAYWGGMVSLGADTFWEVYNQDDLFFSPYKSHLINSYCHAWSCTPTYFIRKYGCNSDSNPQCRLSFADRAGKNTFNSDRTVLDH